MSRSLRNIGITAVMLLSACTPRDDRIDTVEVTIRTPAAEHRFEVELADEPHEISKGLMNREDLGGHDGMLFLSDEPRIPQFWMKDTLIPLDMIFIEEGGAIAHIAADRRPGDLRPVSPEEPVIAVLELEAGKSAQMALREGDIVLLPGAEQ